MGHNVFDTISGAVVLALAALFLMFAYSSADLHKVKGYMVSANFPMVDGVERGHRWQDQRRQSRFGRKTLKLNTEPAPINILSP